MPPPHRPDRGQNRGAALSSPIEDYALLSSGRTAALVSREGSIDWLCQVHDCLPVDPRHLDLVRRVDPVRRIVGVSGEVVLDHSIRLRFDYARAVPWLRQTGTEDAPELTAIAGPDAVIVRGGALTASDHVHRGEVRVAAGERRDLVLTWHPSHRPPPRPLEVDEAIAASERWWASWASHIDASGPHRDVVVRSLLTLRALTHRDTGGIIAAPTTSLPERLGGERNWDYRYVWLRDASLTIEVLLAHGFEHVVEHWRDWLLRAIAGDPGQLQIVYGVGGERARRAGIAASELSWPLERALLRRAEQRLDEPDRGIWEIRGEPRMFTHSRAMVWTAFDRGVRAVREHGLEGPVERWEGIRDAIRAEIDARGVSPRGHFVQHPDTDEVDASLLLPAAGFCAPDDPRMVATVAEIERTLMPDGLVLRYRTGTGVDGVAGSESPFLACSFWLVAQYAAMGRAADAHDLMGRACALVNDVGLLSEGFDPRAERQVGNFPQALSHLALVVAADALERADGHGAV